MKSGSERYWELIERRLELLGQLKRLGTEWRHAFIALDMPTSERVAADENAVCQQIGTIDRELASSRARQSKSTASVETDLIQPRVRAALETMIALHSDLRQSNQVRRAILRRSNLTIHALRNLFNSYAPTYGSPAAPGTGAIYEESV